MAKKAEATAPPNIYARISQVQSEIESVPKKGTNTHFGYDYHKESDILNAIRGPIRKAGIAVTVTEESTRIEGSIIYGTILIRYTNIDDPADYVEQRWTCGAQVVSDKGKTDDKAAAKTFTGAVKQAVAKMFQITDDVDNDLMNGSGSLSTAKQTTANKADTAPANGKGVSRQGSPPENPVTTTGGGKNGDVVKRTQPFTPDKIAAMIQSVGANPKYSEAPSNKTLADLYERTHKQVFGHIKDDKRRQSATQLFFFCVTGQRTMSTMTVGHVDAINNWLRFDGTEFTFAESEIIKKELRACYDKWELGK